MTYPVQFRKKVLQQKETEGVSYAAIVRRYGLAKKTVLNWRKQLEPHKNDPTLKTHENRYGGLAEGY